MQTELANVIASIVANAKIIKNPSSAGLRQLAKKDEITTKFGSATYITKIRNRSAKFTEIIYKKPTKAQAELIDDVTNYLKGKTLICVDKTMCQNPKHEIPCRSYITKDYARVVFMWHEMLFPRRNTTATRTNKPKITLLFVPEWPERKVLVNPKTYTTIALGTDYSGEMKKAGLRLGMYYAKQHGGLGLHTGSKNLTIKDVNGRPLCKGLILFGLSATGKTTLTCHHHWLDERNGERVTIRQDDVVFLWPDGSCTGTENNFYMKTENLDKQSEPLLYKAAISRNAIMENVMVKRQGNFDFHDSTLTSNGRAVIRRRELGHYGKSIDLKKADMAMFITRRNTIVPPIAKLNAEQAAAFFMLGESIETSAGDPTQAGKSIRVVGTNPFIVGPEHEEGNRFYDVVKKTGMECYLLNTGRFGQRDSGRGKSKYGVKIRIEDSSAFIVEAARNNITWKRDPFWGYLVPEKVDGVDMSKFDWTKYYSKKDYETLNRELMDERREWLAKYPKLKTKIRDAIENGNR